MQLTPSWAQAVLRNVTPGAIARWVIAAAAVWTVACSNVPSDARIGVTAPSGSEQDFALVGDFLGHRCGSLDCHGAIGRNLRIWSCEGMRLDPSTYPQCSRRLGGTGTTPDEHLETYRSIVGLEPAVMTTVLAGHVQHPELLTFVRKMRGLEAHKGGTLVTPGDPQDVCITSWLQGQTDMTACVKAQGFPVFPVVDASAP
jgi:hypothetical protein